MQIDATRVRTFHDLGLAVLAQALTHDTARASLSGRASSTVLQILRYFSADCARFARRVAPVG